MTFQEIAARLRTLAQRVNMGGTTTMGHELDHLADQVVGMGDPLAAALVQIHNESLAGRAPDGSRKEPRGSLDSITETAFNALRAAGLI